MLVLSRRIGEKIAVGNDVVIEILSVSGEGVRLGIIAPKETSVHRYEVFVDIENANRAAEDAVNDIKKSSLKLLSAHFQAGQKK
ncbi:MAG: carbon storage regulator CsrA [Pyrinomonadaceae bacterium]|nr:carbon storage regulator CsrA [Pyrinomonadaceae bacterium]